MLKFFFHLVECVLVLLFLRSFTLKDDRRTWLISLIYIMISFIANLMFETYGVNEGVRSLLDALFAFLYLTFTTEKDIYKRIIISLLPNIIIYTATIPLVILISAPFYGTARYVQLLAEHFLLLNTVTKATAALLFYTTSVKMRSTTVPFSLKEYLIIIATLMICDVIYISLLNVFFLEQYDGVSIAVAAVAVAGLLMAAFFAFTDLTKLTEEHLHLMIDHAVLESEGRMNQ